MAPAAALLLDGAARGGRRRAAVLGLVALTALGAAPTALAQTYTVGAVPYSWMPTAGHAVLATWDGGQGCVDTAGDDSLSLPLPIGFTFRFGATGYTQLRVFTNGRVQFANTRCSYGTASVGPPRTYADPMPAANLAGTIRIYGADFDVSAAGGGTISYATVGTAPARVFVVTWNTVPQWNTAGRTSYNLQMQLYESGEFWFMYGTSDDIDAGPGSIGPAQLGWELSTSDYYVQTGLPASLTGLRFRPTTSPSLTVAKTSSVVSDPVNGTSQPKRVPGSVLRYTVTVTNAGSGPVDANTLAISDPVPPNTDLYVAAAGPPVTFTDGTPASGLAFATASVSYSNQAGGGPPYTYLPVPDAAGYDPAVTGLRIAPTGVMNAAGGAGQPSFSVAFRVRVR